MAEDWSREEVVATVAAYFDMLGQELRGLKYNKTEHRRHLTALLNNRSDGAIERKHQNISAILIELGFPYIIGYKPLGNYQQLLFEVAADSLAINNPLLKLVNAHVQEPAALPPVEDILAALVDPPALIPEQHRYTPAYVRERPTARIHVDYLALEARNRSLGAAGEEFVLRFEVARLLNAGKEHLASRVERISETRGDGLGFDILSFDVSGRERFIEVKTTAYGPVTPFFVTRNELAVSHEVNDSYYLYRPFEFRSRPRLFAKPGPLDQSFNLDPALYVSRFV